MGVTLSTLFTDAYNTLKTIINTSVTDPKTNATSSKRRWLYRDLPDTTAQSFAGYPFIVINHADINDDQIIVLNNSYRENEVVFDVEVHTEFDDVEARNDTISSQVLAAIFNSTNITTMQNLKLYSPRIVSTNTNTQYITDRKRVVMRLIRVAYSIDVST